MNAKFYHELEVRQNNRGRTTTKIVGSNAKTIDEAHAERCTIAKKYHVNTLISIVTHSVG